MIASNLSRYKYHNTSITTNLFHGHPAPEDRSSSQVASVSRVTGSHHGFRVKHLLSELRHSQGLVSLASFSCQRSKARHEEVQPWKRHLHKNINNRLFNSKVNSGSHNCLSLDESNGCYNQ